MVVVVVVFCGVNGERDKYKRQLKQLTAPAVEKKLHQFGRVARRLAVDIVHVHTHTCI
jgi:hypothetical protein